MRLERLPEDLGQRIGDGAGNLIALRLIDDQRRRDRDPVVRAANDDAALTSCRGRLPADVQLGIEFGLGPLVGHVLDHEHQTLAADVADVRSVVELAVQLAEQIVAHGAGVGGEVLVLDDLDIAEADRAGDRVPGVGEAVHEHPVWVGHHVEDCIGHRDAAERDVAGGDALGERGDIGLEAVGLLAEHLSGASESADDLVGDEEDIVLLEDRLDDAPIPVRRHHHAAGALNRLADHRRDRAGALFGDQLLELLRQRGQEFVLGHPLGVAVGVRRRKVDVPGHAGAESFVVGRDSGRGERAHRDSVVTHLAGDDLDFVRVGP